MNGGSRTVWFLPPLQRGKVRMGVRIEWAGKARSPLTEVDSQICVLTASSRSVGSMRCSIGCHLRVASPM